MTVAAGSSTSSCEQTAAVAHGRRTANSYRRPSSASLQCDCRLPAPPRDTPTHSTRRSGCASGTGPSQTQALDCASGSGPNGSRTRCSNGCDRIRSTAQRQLRTAPPPGPSPARLHRLRERATSTEQGRRATGIRRPSCTPEQLERRHVPADHATRAGSPLFIPDESRLTTPRARSPTRSEGSAASTSPAGDGMGCPGDHPGQRFTDANRALGPLRELRRPRFGETHPERRAVSVHRREPASRSWSNDSAAVRRLGRMMCYCMSNLM